MNATELYNHPEFQATGYGAVDRITALVNASGLVSDDSWRDGFSYLCNTGHRPSTAIRDLARRAIG